MVRLVPETESYKYVSSLKLPLHVLLAFKDIYLRVDWGV